MIQKHYFDVEYEHGSGARVGELTGDFSQITLVKIAQAISENSWSGHRNYVRVRDAAGECLLTCAPAAFAEGYRPMGDLR